MHRAITTTYLIKREIERHVRALYILVFSQFLGLPGNLGFVKEKPIRKTYFSRGKKDSAPQKRSI